MEKCRMASVSWILLAAVLTICCAGEEDHHGHYTNDFAVELKAEHRHLIDDVAAKHNLKLVRQLSSLGDVYILSHESTASRSKRSAVDLVSVLKEDPRIHYVEQQRILRRVKRTIVHDKQWELPISHYDDKSVYQRFYGDSRLETKDGIPGVSTELIGQVDFDDPYFPDQWYLPQMGLYKPKDAETKGELPGTITTGGTPCTTSSSRTDRCPAAVLLPGS